MIDQKYKEVADDFLGAKALIFIKGTDNVLLMRRGSTAPQAPNEVDLPGGRAEAGESPWATCVRETQEEICIDVNGASVLAAHGGVSPTGVKSWLVALEVPEELARCAVSGPESSEVIVENIDDFLRRSDAWKPFQAFAHYMAKQLNRTDIFLTPYKST